MTRAAGTFSVKSWDENTYRQLDGEAKLTKAAVTFGLEGDLNGEATWEAIMCYRPDGTAVYTGFQHVTGALDGVQGSFVLRADGEFAAGDARSRWQVIEGSGTGGLASLTGNGTAVASASPTGIFEFDYSLG
jgi:Protein of unknown function (DUF3224)